MRQLTLDEIKKIELGMLLCILPIDILKIVYGKIDNLLDYLKI